jgi:hypothetical protein
MRLRDFLILMGSASLVAWGAWAFVLFSIDPTRAGILGLLFFYLTLALASVGTLTVVGTVIRYFTQKDVPVFRHVIKAFRHSIWFSALLCICLVLMAHQLFVWWVVCLIVLALAVVELIIISSQIKRMPFEPVDDSEHK